MSITENHKTERPKYGKCSIIWSLMSNNNKENTYDVLIIGGGAAGIMAAISAKKHHPEFSVALIDRTFALGRKILVAGAGRCNITNLNLNESVENRYYGAAPEFIKSIFRQFEYKDIVDFFNDLGIELYVERKTNIGKLFPVTDQAKTVTVLLEDELKRLGIKIFLNHEVKKINKVNQEYQIDIQQIEKEKPVGPEKSFIGNYIVLSAGGKTYPALGSNGSGYELAKSLGHRIIQPVPSALPLVGKNPISQEANGVKMEIEVTSIINGNEVKKTTNDVMFTQYGLSGPAILNISREISIHLNRENGRNAIVSLNFFPGKSSSEVETIMNSRWLKRPDQTVELSLNGIFAPKFPPIFLKAINIAKDKEAKDLSENEKKNILQNLSNYRVEITDTRGWNEAEFTAGGIDSKEVSEETLESKKAPHIYLCGEILDIDGDVGGFNLSWAWSSGFVAGKLL
jgi:predicted Rossmann fold flavoprotein